jgi:hypothetical protein
MVCDPKGHWICTGETMSMISFVVAVVDDDSEQGHDWRIRMEANLRQAGMTVIPPDEVEVVDIAIVWGTSSRATARRALEYAALTERGSLFSIWIDPRSLAVFLAGDAEDELRATWARKFVSELQPNVDVSAVECDVIVLSAQALRDGVTTSVGIEFDHGFPRISGSITKQERDLSGS